MVFNMLLIDCDNASCVKGKIFEDILDLCFLYCDYFSFTQHDFLWTTDKLKCELEPFLCEKIVCTRWFRYNVTNKNPLTVLLFGINEEAKKIVKKYWNEIFLGGDDGCTGCVQNLEDICFFKEGELVLGTVSHEAICQVFPPNSFFEESLKKIYSQWEYSEKNYGKIYLNDYLGKENIM